MVELSAFDADAEFLKGHTGLFADKFQLINRREVFTALGAGMHLEGASPDFALIPG